MAHRVTNYFWRNTKLYARITYQDKSGKRRQKAQRVASGALADVPHVLRQLRNQIDAGGPNIFVDGKVRLGDYLDLWREITKGSRSEKTNADYESLIRLYIKPALESVELAKICAMQVQALYASLRERGYSSRTIRYTHAVLAAAVKQAIRWDKLKKNPLDGVTLPKKEHKEMRVLDEREVTRFVRECAKERNGLIFELALYTGARPEEYLGLQWRDIDFEKGVLKVERKVRHNRKGGGWYFGPLKTEKSRRSFPLDEPLLLALRRHKLAQWQMRHERFEKSQPYERHDLIFASETGTPLSVRNLQRDCFKPLLKKASVPNIRLYDLRHTCATLLLAKGTDIKTVSEWLGHANPDETLRTYAHVLPSMKLQAGRNIALAMRG